MAHTHATTLNGQSTVELTNPFRTETERLRWMLENLDGTERYAWCLWRMPEGVRLGDVTARSEEYLQCAGNRERMTVEVRRQEGPGVFRQYVLGRPGASEERASEHISWDAYSTKVRPSEVFDSEEAFGIFLTYYQTDDVPAVYELRELDLR